MRTYNIMKRIVLQMFSDKRSLAMILIAPLFLFTLIFLLFGDSDYKASIAQAGLPAQIVEKIENQGVTVLSVRKDDGEQKVRDGVCDALLYADAGGIHMVFKSYDATKTGIVQKAVAAAVKELSPASAIQVGFLYGDSSASLFDNLSYALLGIISFFLIFIIAGISFVRERTNQTIERLMVTPVRRWQVVLGFTLGFGVFAILQSVILLLFSMWILGVTVAGSSFTAGLIMLMLALSAVCIGAFFSIFSNNEFQMAQFIPVVVIPQIFFSGLFSIDTLPYHLGALARIMPIYYACSALKTVMVVGGGLNDIWPELLALLLFILVFFCINILALKKYRKI